MSGQPNNLSLSRHSPFAPALSPCRRGRILSRPSVPLSTALLCSEVLEKLLADPKAPASAARRSELTTLRNKAGAMNAEELKSQFATFNIRSPSSNNPLTDPFAFNLMFQTSIGPSGSAVGYLRPETAQGIFVNYRRLLDFNNGKARHAHTQLHTEHDRGRQRAHESC